MSGSDDKPGARREGNHGGRRQPGGRKSNQAGGSQGRFDRKPNKPPQGKASQGKASEDDPRRGGSPSNRGQGGRPQGARGRGDRDDKTRFERASGGSGRGGHDRHRGQQNRGHGKTGGNDTGGDRRMRRDRPSDDRGQRRDRSKDKPTHSKQGGSFTDDRRRDDRDRRKTPEGTSDSSSTQQNRPRSKTPELPEGAIASELPDEVRRELRAIPKVVADDVAAHLVAAGMLLEEEPEKALEHARYARRRASRISSVREANGLTAYQMGEWNEALSELRAARRMGGEPHVATIADCERALGRPQRALDMSREPEITELSDEQRVELRIVAAGARRDLGQLEAAVVSLQGPELDPQRHEPWSARLFYAYADNLLAAGRTQEAFTWFVHAANVDDEDATDAADRLEELVDELGGVETAEQLAAEAGAVGISDEPSGAAGADTDSAAEPEFDAPNVDHGSSS